MPSTLASSPSLSLTSGICVAQTPKVAPFAKKVPAVGRQGCAMKPAGALGAGSSEGEGLSGMVGSESRRWRY